MSSATGERVRICPQCQSENLPIADKCWLCHGKLAGDNEVVVAEVLAKDTKRAPLTDWFFGGLTIVILLLIVLIGIGIGIDDASMLIPYAIFLAPALLATAGRALISTSRGEGVSGTRVFVTFLVSISATILVVLVLFIAAIIAFCAMCFYALSQAGMVK